MSATATATATATPVAKVNYVQFNGVAFIDATLIKSKGSAHGTATWQAFEGFYSQCLQGGMRGDLSATTSKHPTIARVHNAPAKELTNAGKAFKAIADQAMAVCKRVGKPTDQDAHDLALLEISALWSGCFVDAKPRVKSTEPTPKQVIDALRAELHAMTIERDHAMAQLVTCQESLALARVSTTV